MSPLRAQWQLVANEMKRQKEQTLLFLSVRAHSFGASITTLRCLAGDEASIYEATYKIETDTQLTEAQLLKAFKAVLVFPESSTMLHHVS